MNLEGILIKDQAKDTLLYAGAVKVRITDWFFFKKKVELKYVRLEDAIIKFQRKDSVWSQQFLFDYFSSPPSGNKKKEGGTALDLKKVELKNVSFLKKDAWLGQDMIVKIGALDLDADKIDFSAKMVAINSLTIDKPVVTMYNYSKLKPATVKAAVVTTETIDSLLKWNQAGWMVHLDKLKIENGIFRNEKQSDTPAFVHFDGRHIEFSSINGEFTDVRWNKDTITTRLSLQTKERSGFEVKNMMADAKLTPQGMAFSNLEIKTNNSVIKNTFAMAYDDFDDMGDFISKIRLLGNFENSEIDSDDIAFFAPALKSWKKRIILNGKVRGTIDDLTGKDMLIQAGSSTLLNGDISMTGLPDIHQTFIDFKANDFRPDQMLSPLCRLCET